MPVDLDLPWMWQSRSVCSAFSEVVGEGGGAAKGQEESLWLDFSGKLRGVLCSSDLCFCKES